MRVMEELMPRVVVSRYQLLPSGLHRSHQRSWKWAYNVHVPGKPKSDRGPGLKSAMAWAKREAKLAGLPVVKQWEEES